MFVLTASQETDVFYHNSRWTNELQLWSKGLTSNKPKSEKPKGHQPLTFSRQGFPEENPDGAFTLGCSSLTMMHASFLSIWYVIKWHKIRPLQKNLNILVKILIQPNFCSFEHFYCVNQVIKWGNNVKFWFRQGFAIICSLSLYWLAPHNQVSVWTPHILYLTLHCTLYCTLY